MGAGAIPIQIEKVIKERAGSTHKLKVYIAHSSYCGEDRIDVSFHGGHHIMLPPRQVLFDYKMGRTSQRRQGVRGAFFAFLFVYIHTDRLMRVHDYGPGHVHVKGGAL